MMENLKSKLRFKPLKANQLKDSVLLLVAFRIGYKTSESSARALKLGRILYIFV